MKELWWRQREPPLLIDVLSFYFESCLGVRGKSVSRIKGEVSRELGEGMTSQCETDIRI